MLEKKVTSMMEAAHLATNRISIAGRCHEIIRLCNSQGKQLKNDLENINACKFLYRKFLKEIIDGKRTVNVSEQDYKKWVLDAYEESDFDWTDYSKFQPYCDKFGHHGWVEKNQNN